MTDGARAKTVLITGATDGVGLEAAKTPAGEGCDLLLHGRNAAKLDAAAKAVSDRSKGGSVETYAADLSSVAAVDALASAVAAKHDALDVLINNAGVFTPGGMSADGLDLRFMVNTIAPYRLAKRLAPLLGAGSRVVNLSSAAQAPVDLAALKGRKALSDSAAYAQSKLALTMWSRAPGLLGDQPMVVAVNPGSMLGAKMVKDAYGVSGGDVGIGADILARAALGADFANAHGRYFDNDSGRFADPHPQAMDAAQVTAVVDAIEEVLASLGGG